MIKKLALVACLLVAREAHATKCADNKRFATDDGSTHPMLDVLNRLGPNWEDSPGRYGIRHLFADKAARGATPAAGESVCINCHTANSFAPFCTGCAAMYTPCGVCHTSNPDSAILIARKPYPDWLDFTTKDNLKRAAYYAPGHSKAEASLMRARDGSMPPGALAGPFDYAGTVTPATGEYAVGWRAHGWCDEIADAVQAWIDAGYP